jgi:hypothetical protein
VPGSGTNRASLRYLLQSPLPGELVEDGLNELGYNITDEESRA